MASNADRTKLDAAQIVAWLISAAVCTTVLGCGKDRAAAAADKEPASPTRPSVASAPETPAAEAPAAPSGQGRLAPREASAAPGAAADPAKPQDPLGAPKVSEASFDLEIQPKGS